LIAPFYGYTWRDFLVQDYTQIGWLYWAGVFAMLGLFKQAIFHFSVLAPVGTPTDPMHLLFAGRPFPGYYKVKPVFYLADSVIDFVWTCLEAFGVFSVVLSFGMAIEAANPGSLFYIAGFLQEAAAVVYAVISAYRLVYIVANLRIYADVPQGQYLEIPALYLWSLVDKSIDGYSSFLGFLVYWEQLVLGNKRLGLLNDVFMGAILLLHPRTLPGAAYFLAQLPIQIFYDLLLFPLFPQYDVPYVPWQFLFGY